MVKTHNLKTEPTHWWDVHAGRKKAEIRYDDRNYQVGDIVGLWIGTPGITTHFIEARISHILRVEDFPQGLQPGYVMLSLEDPRNLQVVA